MLAHQRSPVVGTGRARRGGRQQKCAERTDTAGALPTIETSSWLRRLVSRASVKSKRDVGARFDLTRLEQTTLLIRMRDCLPARAHDTMFDERALIESWIS